MNTATITISHDPLTDALSMNFTFHPPASPGEPNPAVQIALGIAEMIENSGIFDEPNIDAEDCDA